MARAISYTAPDHSKEIISRTSCEWLDKGPREACRWGETQMKGHIRERSPGHWAIVIEQRDPATGKRKRRWHSFTGTKRTAQIECARLISELQRGTYLEPNKITVGAISRPVVGGRKGAGHPQDPRALRRDCKKEHQSASRRSGSDETAADADIRCLRQSAFRRPQGWQGRTCPRARCVTCTSS